MLKKGKRQQRPRATCFTATLHTNNCQQDSTTKPNLDIRLVCSSSNTIRSISCHPKDPIKPMDQINVIYKIPCKDCSKSYVGENGRRLEDRKKDHQAAVKRGDMDKNVIAYHCWNQDHTMDWNGTERLSTEDQWFRRRIKESIWVRKRDVNQDDGNSYVKDHCMTSQ